MPKQISFKSVLKFIIEKINKIDALISLPSSNTMFQFDFFWRDFLMSACKLNEKKPVSILNLNKNLPPLSSTWCVSLHSSRDKISFKIMKKKRFIVERKMQIKIKKYAKEWERKKIII